MKLFLSPSVNGWEGDIRSFSCIVGLNSSLFLFLSFCDSQAPLELRMKLLELQPESQRRSSVVKKREMVKEGPPERDESASSASRFLPTSATRIPSSAFSSSLTNRLVGRRKRPRISCDTTSLAWSIFLPSSAGRCTTRPWHGSTFFATSWWCWTTSSAVTFSPCLYRFSSSCGDCWPSRGHRLFSGLQSSLMCRWAWEIALLCIYFYFF